MKCQKCSKPATFHITEMTDEHPVDLHFCEKHAGEYLRRESHSGGGDEVASAKSGTTKKDGGTLQGTTRELMEIDFQTCPFCGIGFNEFRKTGKLGCPNDYQCFGELLEPLLLSIHGDTEHFGRRPTKHKGKNKRSQLIRLRRELDDAVAIEDYERATVLRDRIRAIES